MRNLTRNITAGLVVGASLLAGAGANAATPPPTPKPTPSPSPTTPKPAPKATYKQVKVYGMKVQVQMPTTWATASPAQLDRTRPKSYPEVINIFAGPRADAKAFVHKNRAMNLLAQASVGSGAKATHGSFFVYADASKSPYAKVPMKGAYRWKTPLGQASMITRTVKKHSESIALLKVDGKVALFRVADLREKDTQHYLYGLLMQTTRA